MCICTWLLSLALSRRGAIATKAKSVGWKDALFKLIEVFVCHVRSAEHVISKQIPPDVNSCPVDCSENTLVPWKKTISFKIFSSESIIITPWCPAPAGWRKAAWNAKNSEEKSYLQAPTFLLLIMNLPPTCSGQNINMARTRTYGWPQAETIQFMWWKGRPFKSTSSKPWSIRWPINWARIAFQTSMYIPACMAPNLSLTLFNCSLNSAVDFLQKSDSLRWLSFVNLFSTWPWKIVLQSLDWGSVSV